MKFGSSLTDTFKNKFCHFYRTLSRWLLFLIDAV